MTVSESVARERILHVLSVYPAISHSMLQIGVGTSYPPSVWKPVLDALIAEGIVKQIPIQAITPSQRAQAYNVLCLCDYDYKHTSIGASA